MRNVCKEWSFTHHCCTSIQITSIGLQSSQPLRYSVSNTEELKILSNYTAWSSHWPGFFFIVRLPLPSHAHRIHTPPKNLTIPPSTDSKTQWRFVYPELLFWYSAIFIQNQNDLIWWNGCLSHNMRFLTWCNPFQSFLARYPPRRDPHNRLDKIKVREETKGWWITIDDGNTIYD